VGLRADRTPAPGEQVPFGERLHDPFFWALVKKRLGYLLGAVGFLATFGAVGIFAGYLAITTVIDGVRAPHWPQVPATIESVGDGTATYAYEYRGVRYRNDRLGTFWLGGTSETDDWDQRMAAKLEAAQSSGTPVMAFVNPDKPREAMLDTELRWKLLMFCLPFALGFGGVGIAGFAFFMVRALGLDSISTQPIFKPKTREMFTQWFFGTLWNVVSMPIALLFIPEMYAKGEWFPILFVAIFPLIGVLILWGALITTWRVIRDGNPFNPAFFEDLHHSMHPKGLP
jgi:hypothetical protein